ncbi:hypothetical protein TH9_12235 [Thalassospira xiamenensis]|nr:hypothetical protein TH9_12235 [Thalassospira xiamenensis]
MAMTYLRAYEAAKPSRQNDGWHTPSTGPKTEVGTSIVALRNRSRQLVRDNAYAKRIVDVIQSNLIGDGIITQADSGSEEIDRTLQKAWDDWSGTTQCDADGITNLAGIQRMAAAAMTETGEVIIRLRYRTAAQARQLGLAVPLQLQLIEGDYLDHTRNANMADGGYIVQGVEFNKSGKRVAYWLFTNHPGDYTQISSTKLQSIRIPADQVIHLYDAKRPGQVRGVSELHAAILPLRNLQDYQNALLMKAKIEACFCVFARGMGSSNPVTGKSKSDGRGGRIETIEPGSINYIDGAEDISFANPSNSDAHVLLSKTFQLAVAIASGVTYDQLSGDLTGANYSSLRAGKIEVRRRNSQLQWTLWIPGMCQRVWQGFLHAGLLVSKWDRDDYRAEHTPPGHEMIDPAKDTAALRDQIRIGVKSWPEAVRQMGSTPRQMVEDLKKYNDVFDKESIVLDSDPRKTSRAGLSQDQAGVKGAATAD